MLFVIHIEIKFVIMRFSGRNFPRFVEADTHNKVNNFGQSLHPLTTLCRNKQSLPENG